MFYYLFTLICIKHGASTLQGKTIVAHQSHAVVVLRVLMTYAPPHTHTHTHTHTHLFNCSSSLRLNAGCARADVLVVTDEIYEHIIFDGAQHIPLASSQFPGMAERTCVVNAVSKTFKATGWRVGWVLSPKSYTAAIRATHDQLVLQVRV
jgi:hypothetical protein